MLCITQIKRGEKMDLVKYDENLFESIKHVNEYGQEFWYARDLQKILEYTEWRNFTKVIDRAKEACNGAGHEVSECFVEVNKTSEMPNGGTKRINDFMLSRYACYLIVMNGDPRKEVIALGQTYFAVKTRQQELIEDYEKLTEEQKRLAIRNEMKRHNIALADAAHKAGVQQPIDYAVFQNYGYMGLYNGLKAQDIKERKGLKKNQNILDFMGSTELAANLFRATQTEEKLRRENIQGKNEANQTHYEVGKKVRQTIADLGGTMPEDLPTPEKSTRQIEKEHEKKKIEDK